MTGHPKNAGWSDSARLALALALLLAGGAGALRAQEPTPWQEDFEAGTAALGKGELSRAEELFTSSLEKAQAAGADSGNLGRIVDQLRSVYLAMSAKAPSWKEDLAAGKEAISAGKVLAAEVRLTRALERAEASRATPRQFAEILDQLGIAWFVSGEREMAEATLRRALRIKEDALGPDHPDIAFTLKQLARIEEKAGNRKEVRELLEKAVELRTRGLGCDHPDVADSLIDLGAFYDVEGENQRAEKLYLRAVAILEKAYGGNDPKVAEALSNLIGLYRKMGREEEARELEKRSSRIWERHEEKKDAPPRPPGRDGIQVWEKRR